MNAPVSWFSILLPIILVLLSVGWLLWLWLKASDEPGALVKRWLASVVVLGPLFWAAAHARDESSKIGVILLAAVGGIIMTLVWRQPFCDFVGDLFGGLYTGGSQQVDPAPFYSIAQAKRKKGQYLEAIAEVEKQLERFPTDFTGWMLLAEIQAEDLRDLPAAHETVMQFLQQDGHPPKNIAFILTREADWSLKVAQDREAARTALQTIVDLLPDTEQEQLARQRLAHLAPPELLAERQQPRSVALPPGVENVGLRLEPLEIKRPEEDPAAAAANYVAHLQAFPFDSDAREKLALLYARHYQRLDLATDQLEQLIACPNQPPKQVVHWLNSIADLQVQLAGDVDLARSTLQRILDLFPKSAAAENARHRLAHLKLELRPRQTSQAVRLGSYEQNLGLKGRGDSGKEL
jgi:tetratricopeptide (TPR) repeat protein